MTRLQSIFPRGLMAVCVLMLIVAPVPIHAAQPLEPNRFITQWLVAGPFDFPPFSQLDPLDVPIMLDEGQAHPAAGDEVIFRGQRTAWTPVTSPIVDVTQIFPDTQGRLIGCAYGFAEIDCAEDGEFVLNPIFGDSMKIWVNGKIAAILTKPPAISDHSNEIAVALAKGRNTIFIKIGNRSDFWGFGLFLEPVNGCPIRILETNSEQNFQFSILPNATAVIHDASGSGAPVTISLAGFGGYYRGSFILPSAAFSPGRIVITTEATPWAGAHRQELERLETPVNGADYQFQLPYSGQISGRVFDRDTGFPLPAAKIRIGRRMLAETVSNIDGQFEYRQAIPGRNIIQIETPGYHPWRGNFPRFRGDERDPTFVELLQVNRLIEGEVINGWSGKPIPNVEIDYSFGFTSGLKAWTDNRGQYAIQFNYERLSRFWAIVLIDGFHYPSFGLNFRPSDQELQHDMELFPMTLNASATLASGEPWTSATITLFHYLFPDRQMVKTAAADSQGRARFSMLPEGTYLLAAFDDIHGVATRRIDVKGPVVNATLSASAAASAGVVIQRFDGQPAAGAGVDVRPFAADAPIALNLKSDSQGRIQLPPIMADNVHLKVELSGQPALVYSGPLGALPSTLTFPLPSRIIAEVRNQAGGVIPNASMILRHRERINSPELALGVWRAADGRFVIECSQTPPDISAWSWLVKAPGFASRLINLPEFARQAAQGSPVVITMAPATKRSIVFQSPSGAEVSDVSIAWFNPEFPFDEGADSYFPEPLVALSGPQVKAQMPWPVPAGESWNVLAWKPYYGYALLMPGQEWPATVSLQQFARLSGRIQMTGLSRQESYIMAYLEGDLAKAGLKRIRRSYIRPGGSFEISDMIPGLWRLEIYNQFGEFGSMLDTSPVYTARVTVQSLVSTYIEIPDPDAGSVAGLITTSSDEPVFATIILDRQTGNPAESQKYVIYSDWEGRYLMDGVMPGEWRVSIHPRYTSWGRPYFTDFSRVMTETITVESRSKTERAFIFDK